MIRRRTNKLLSYENHPDTTTKHTTPTTCCCTATTTNSLYHNSVETTDIDYYPSRLRTSLRWWWWWWWVLVFLVLHQQQQQQQPSNHTTTAAAYGFHNTVGTWKPQQQQQGLAATSLKLYNYYPNTPNWMWWHSYRSSSFFVHSSFTTTATTTTKIATFQRRKRFAAIAAAMHSSTTDGSDDDSNNIHRVDDTFTNHVEHKNNKALWMDHMNRTTHEFHSLTNLQRRVSHLLQQQQQQQLVQQNFKISFAIAGGGGHLLSTLAATPGASSILLEGTIPYSREAFREYIQQKGTDIDDSTFKYCSEMAAQRLATAAYHRALHLTTTNAVAEQKSANWTNVLRSPMGVASTSVLQSTIYTTATSDGSPVRTTRRSVERYGSRAFCAIQTSSGLQIQLQIQLAKMDATTMEDSTTSENRRTRLDEDVLVSHYLLSAIELYHHAKNSDDVVQILGIDTEEPSYNINNNMDQLVIQGGTFQGDKVTVKLPASFCVPKISGSDFDEINNTTATKSTIMTVDDPLRKAAQRVLSGQDEVVMILLPQGDCNNNGSSSGTIEVMDVTMLPPHSLVVPGSFNPIHAGHIALAQAAAKAMVEPCNAIWFELSITNVDKPALAIDAIIERIKYFFPLRHELPSDMCWGILLTNAPLFKQKVDLLAPLQFSSPNRILHFSIGTDTLVRLIDPKYYNNSEDDMLHTLRDMSCHFVVGGRLDQKKKSSNNNNDDDNDVEDTMFIAGDEVVATLPLQIRDKFTILPDFRIDLSSTEIRQQMEAEQQSNPSL